MLSQEYLTQLDERSQHVKVAFSPAGLDARLWNWMRPFQNKKMFSDFSKHFKSQQPWLKHTNQSMDDVVKYMHNEQPISTMFSRAFNRNPEKFATRAGKGFQKHFSKKNPEAYAKAQQTVGRNRGYLHAGIGAGALGAGALAMGY